MNPHVTERYCCEENNQLSYCLLGWLLVILFPLSWKKDKRFNYYFLLELFVQLLSKSIKTNQSHRNLHFVRLMAVTVEDSVRIGENSEKRNLWKGGFYYTSTGWTREKKVADYHDIHSNHSSSFPSCHYLFHSAIVSHVSSNAKGSLHKADLCGKPLKSSAWQKWKVYRRWHEIESLGCWE